MSGSNVLDSVLKVLYGLEYLQLEEKIPKIVLMPDLMICIPCPESDFRKLARTQPDGRSIAEDSANYEIDGHASIGARTLSVLQDRDDDLFDLVYVVKTDETGLGFARKALQEEVSKRGGRPIDLRYVLTTGRLRKILVVEKEKPKRLPDPLHEEDHLRYNELANLDGFISNVQQATVLGLLDIANIICYELLKRTSSQNSKTITFVDVYCTGKSTDREHLQKLRDNAKKISVVSLSEIEAVRFASLLARETGQRISFSIRNAFEAAKFLHEKLECGVFLHTETYMALMVESEQIVVPTFDIKPKATNGAGDTVNAGMMLALAVKSSLERLRNDSLPGDLMMTYEDCLLFADVVAGARLKEGRYADKDELINFLKTTILRDSRKCEARDFLAHDIELHTDSLKDVFRGEEADPIERLSKLLSHLNSDSLLGKIFAVHEMRNHYASVGILQNLVDRYDRYSNDVRTNALSVVACCSLRNHRHKVHFSEAADPRKALLLDLDGTLFNSKETRLRAARNSLAKLRKGYEDYGWLWQEVYDDSEFYQRIGFQSECGDDFRVDWNQPYFLKVMIVLIENFRIPVSEKRGKKFYENLKRTTPEEFQNTLVREVEKVTDEDVSDARKSFEKTQFCKYTGLRRFLRALRNLGVNLYVATQGSESAQIHKLKKLGLYLDDSNSEGFFDMEHIIAANTVSDINPLRKVLSRKLTDKKYVRKKRTQQMIQSVLDILRTSRIPRYSRVEFFRRVIAAIAGDPGRVRSSFKSPRHVSNLIKNFEENVESRPLRVVGIGDNPATDCQPLRMVNPAIVSCRILRGSKYESELAGEPRPQLEISNYAQAMLYLMKRNTWQDSVVDKLYAKTPLTNDEKNLIKLIDKAEKALRENLEMENLSIKRCLGMEETKDDLSGEE